MARKPAQGSARHERPNPRIPKSPTGIVGLDEVLEGGLPRGRSTLLCGGPGAGKTLMAMEFLVNGATEFDEPGVFIAFEEKAEELAANFASLGDDLDKLMSDKKLVIDRVQVDPAQILEVGDYDLDGLFIRLEYAIDSVGAKRVVIDTIEALFSGLSNAAVLRAELRRLFLWLKTKGVTAVITAERGDDSLTRYGLEEYVADCVILLDHRVTAELATRRMRIIKYRGSSHGTGEYPYLIDQGGLSILPVTSMRLDYEVSDERVSTGVERLDTMLGGPGYFRGSSVLISGTAGTGKTSLSAHFAQACAQRREKCLWFAFEESPNQIVRNMRSIGIDLAPAIKKGTLRIEAERPTTTGLEMHLLRIRRMVDEYGPRAVIIDPISNFMTLGSDIEVRLMMMRLVDFFKAHMITSLFTSLTSAGEATEATQVGVSSLMDTWLLLRDLEVGAERNRLMHLLKSRGMAHSNQVREFLLTSDGVQLQDVYIGPAGGLLTGSALMGQQAQEESDALIQLQAAKDLERELEIRRRTVEAQVAALEAGFEIELLRAQQEIARAKGCAERAAEEREKIAAHRQADVKKGKAPSKRKSGVSD